MSTSQGVELPDRRGAKPAFGADQQVSPLPPPDGGRSGSPLRVPPSSTKSGSSGPSPTSSARTGASSTNNSKGAVSPPQSHATTTSSIVVSPSGEVASVPPQRSSDDNGTLKDSARDIPGSLPHDNSNPPLDDNGMPIGIAPLPGGHIAVRRNTTATIALNTSSSSASANNSAPSRNRGLSVAMNPLPLGSLIGGNSTTDEKNTSTVVAASSVLGRRQSLRHTVESVALDKEIAKFEEDAKRGSSHNHGHPPQPFPSITIATEAVPDGRDENKSLFTPSATSPGGPTRTPSPRAAGASGANAARTPPANNTRLGVPGADGKRHSAKKNNRGSRGAYDPDDGDEETGLALLTSRALAKAEADRNERDRVHGHRREASGDRGHDRNLSRSRSPAAPAPLSKPSDLTVPLAGSSQATTPAGGANDDGERGRALRHKVFDLMQAFDERMRDMRHLWVELCAATGFVSESTGMPSVPGLGPRFGSSGGGLPAAAALGSGQPTSPANAAVQRKLQQARVRRDSSEVESSGLHALVESRTAAKAPSDSLSIALAGGNHARRHSVRLQPLPQSSRGHHHGGGGSAGSTALWGAVADQMDLELPLKTPRHHMKQKSGSGTKALTSARPGLARQQSSKDDKGPKTGGGSHLSVPGGAGSPASPTHKLATAASSGAGPVVPGSPGGALQGPAATPVSAISIPAPPVLAPPPQPVIVAPPTTTVDAQASLISAASAPSSISSAITSPPPATTSMTAVAGLEREGSGSSSLLLERKLLRRGESRGNVLKNTTTAAATGTTPAASTPGTARAGGDGKEGTPREGVVATPGSAGGPASTRHARRMTRTSIMTGGMMMGDPLALAGASAPPPSDTAAIMASAIAANIGKDNDTNNSHNTTANNASSHAVITIKDSSEAPPTSPDPDPVDDPTMRQPLVSEVHGRRPSQAARFFELQNSEQQPGGGNGSGRRGSRSQVGGGARRSLANGPEGPQGRRKSTPFADLKAVKNGDEEGNKDEGTAGDNNGTLVPVDNEMRDINEGEEEDDETENEQAARSFGRFFNSIQPGQRGLGGGFSGGADRYRAEEEGHEHRWRERCTQFWSGMPHDAPLAFKRFHPRAPFRTIWSILAILGALYFVISSPLRMAFATSQPTGGLFALTLILEIIWIIDIVFKFFTGYRASNSDETVTYDLRLIARRYRKSYLIPDVISVATLPLLFVEATHVVRALTCFFMLLRFSKLPAFLTDNLLGGLGSESFALLRLVKFLIAMVLTAHVMSCTWSFIGVVEESEGYLINWARSYDIDINDSPTVYLSALVYSVQTMTGVGYGDIHSVTNAERVYSTFAMLLTCSGFAYFLANISSLISNEDSTQSRFQEKVRSISAFMRYRNVPKFVQERVRNYYNYAFDQRKMYPFDDEHVLSDLSVSLQREIFLYMNKDLVEKVPFFKGRDPNFIRSVMFVMKPMIFAPGDIIVIEGEVGRSMYFIVKGQVEVFSRSEDVVYKRLSDGMYFGELSLLLTSRRTASVRATTHCDLYSLVKSDLDRILLDYPEVANYMKRSAEQAAYQFTPMEKQAMKKQWGKFEKAVKTLMSQNGVQTPFLSKAERILGKAGGPVKFEDIINSHK